MNNLFKYLSFLTLSLVMIACSENEPTTVIGVKKVDNHYEDEQGLSYRLVGNNVIISGGRWDFNTVTIPAEIKYEKNTWSVIGIDRGVFDYNTNLDSIYVSPLNQYLADNDGVLYDKLISKLLVYPKHRHNATFIFPPTTKSVDNYVFSRNTYLKVVDFSNSVTEIGADAFWGCDNLSEISTGALTFARLFK